MSGTPPPGHQSSLLGDSMFTPDILRTVVARYWDIFRKAATQAGQGAVRTQQGVEDPFAVLEFHRYALAEFERQVLHTGRQYAQHPLQVSTQVAPNAPFARAVQQSRVRMIMNGREGPWDHPRTGGEMINRHGQLESINEQLESIIHHEGIERINTPVALPGQAIESGGSTTLAMPATPVGEPSGARPARRYCEVPGCPKYGEATWRYRCVILVRGHDQVLITCKSVSMSKTTTRGFDILVP